MLHSGYSDVKKWEERERKKQDFSLHYTPYSHSKMYIDRRQYFHLIRSLFRCLAESVFNVVSFYCHSFVSYAQLAGSIHAISNFLLCCMRAAHRSEEVSSPIRSEQLLFSLFASSFSLSSSPSSLLFHDFSLFYFKFILFARWRWGGDWIIHAAVANTYETLRRIFMSFTTQSSINIVRSMHIMCWRE